VLAPAERIKALTASASDIVPLPYASAHGADFEDIRVRVPDLTRLRELIGDSPAAILGTMLPDTIEDGRRRVQR